MSKALRISLTVLPVLLMVGAVPFVKNDYILTVAFILVIILLFFFKHDKDDVLVFTLGLFAMMIGEYLFISTGVETFNRNSLFGLMPLWLPFLWGYVFVVIKRSLQILDSNHV